MRGRDQKADDSKRRNRKPGHQMSFAKFNTDLQAEYLSWIERGATLSGAARKVGCSRYLIREFMKGNPTFADQVEEVRKAGLQARTGDVEDALYKSAIKGNVTACLAWLYNRAPDKWRDMRSFRIHGLEDVLNVLPPALAKQLRPLLNGSAN